MIPTTDLCDEFRDQLTLAKPIFRQFGLKRTFAGPIKTVKVFEDNVLVKKALETIPEGSVLVVDGGGSMRCALMGDMLAEIAVNRNLAGIIIHGMIRDSQEINEMNIGIFSLGTNPFKSIKEGKGETDVPVEFGGVEWKPGEWVYADEDGIVLAKEKLK